MVLPLASASATQNALVALFVVLLAAKIGEEICRRIDQPPILGEILAGVLIGPSVFDLVQPDEILEVFSELGVVFLLFMVGLETRLDDMKAVGKTALNVGIMGVVVPLLGGFGISEDGGVSISSVAILLLGAVVFIGVVAVVGSKALARYPKCSPCSRS